MSQFFGHKKSASDWSYDNYEDYRIYINYGVAEWWMKEPNFRQSFRIIHILTDVCPYWSQASLILAIAVERYILICKGAEAEAKLTKRNRLMFYGAVLCLGSIVPILIIIQHLVPGIVRVSASKQVSKFFCPTKSKGGAAREEIFGNMQL